MNFIIKKATAKDIDEIVKIIDFALSNDFSAYNDKTILAYRNNVFNKRYFQEFIKDKKNIIFNTYIQDKLVGLITFKLDYGGIIYMEWIAVDKSYRGKGLGSKLLDFGEKWAIKNKYHCVSLTTTMERQVKFYEKHGYHILGIYKNGWFGESDIVMTKSLRNKPFEEVFEIKK